MSSSQFSEWLAYATVEPFGEYRAELRHGQQMCLAANINRDSKKCPQPFAPIDFMNFVDRPNTEPVEETPEQLSRRIEVELFRGMIQ